MQTAGKSPQRTIANSRNRARGYMLITLMLFITLLSIGLFAMLPEITQQIKRDREEEMIHRALEYSRAIKRFYKKFGRYPTRIEELENTNSLRFIRKRYKDPITGKDFKILHMQDVTLNNGPVLPGASGFVGAQGGGVRQAGPGDANTPQVTGLPGQSNTSDKQSSDDDDSSGNSKSGSSSSSSSSSSAISASGSGLTGQVFGGGPILGVASTSKETTIREFDKKNHYNDWLFIYDPSSDRGGMLNTPWQQSTSVINGATPMSAMPGAPGAPGQPGPNAGPGVGPQPPQQNNPSPQPMPPDQ